MTENGKRYVNYPVFVGTMLVITGAIFSAGGWMFSDLKSDIRADYKEIKEDNRANYADIKAEIRLLRTNP